MPHSRMAAAHRSSPRSTAPRGPLLLAALVTLCLCLCCGLSGSGQDQSVARIAELLPLRPEAATAGLQRLTGTLSGLAPPLTGPVSGQPCVCMEVVKATRSGSGKNRKTHRSTLQRSCTAFELQGPTHRLPAPPSGRWQMLGPIRSRKQGSSTIEEQCLSQGAEVELLAEVDRSASALLPQVNAWISPEPQERSLRLGRLKGLAGWMAAWICAVGLCWSVASLLRARGPLTLGLALVGAPGLLWIGQGLAERAGELERRQLDAAFMLSQLEGPGLREAQRAALAEAIDWRARDQARLLSQLLRARLDIPRIPRPAAAPQDRLPPALQARPSPYGLLPAFLALLVGAYVWSTAGLWRGARRWPPRPGARVELLGRLLATGAPLQAPLTEEPALLWTTLGELREKAAPPKGKGRAAPRWWTVEQKTEALPLRLRLEDDREAELKLGRGLRLESQRELVLTHGREVERLFGLPRPTGLILPPSAQGRLTLRALPPGAWVLIRGREANGALVVDELIEAEPDAAAYLRDQGRASWLSWMMIALGLQVCAICVGVGWVGAEERVWAGLLLLLLGLLGLGAASAVARQGAKA